MDEPVVSKERSRKARQRLRQGGKSNDAYGVRRARLLLGLALGCLTWLAISILMLPPNVWGNLFTSPVYQYALRDSVFTLAAVIVAVFCMGIVEPSLLQRSSRQVLMAIVVLLSAACGRLVYSAADTFAWISVETARFLTPFVMAPLLSGLLLGGRAAIVLGCCCSLMFFIYSGFQASLLFAGLLISTGISLTVQQVRTRSRVVRHAVVCGLLPLPMLLLLWTLTSGTMEMFPVLYQAAACVASALLTAIAVLLVLPLFEHLFDISSNISLLEFADLSHPLLQRLALEAPGTYHHSLVVANIAQAAAEAIEANSLTARVAAYFHDIGKLTKPNFFAENIHQADNPHDHLTPSMSTLIITSHVKEGLSLARLHKLPEPVRRAILEHHGSSVLQCFHHKAISQLELEMGLGANDAARVVDDHCFRYPGPRPSTKVSGIICLADAVEAASRSLEKPTPKHIEDLVDDIVRKRLNDGQLDECELSCVDLARIRKAFVFTLTTMLHGRLAYPKEPEADS